MLLHFGAVVAKPVLPICPNPDYPAQWLAIELTQDPTPLVRKDPTALAAALLVPRSPLCRSKTNGMPLVLSGDHPATKWIIAANVLPNVPAYARLLPADVGFADRLAEAANMARCIAQRSTSKSGCTRGDSYLRRRMNHHFAAFHASAPSEKFAIAQSMQDERARYLAGRVIYNEWPRELPADYYTRIDRERRARYHQSNAPWTTIDIAFTEIAKLQTSADPLASAILDEYQSYLHSLGASDAA